MLQLVAYMSLTTLKSFISGHPRFLMAAFLACIILVELTSHALTGSYIQHVWLSGVLVVASLLTVYFLVFLGADHYRIFKILITIIGFGVALAPWRY